MASLFPPERGTADMDVYCENLNQTGEDDKMHDKCACINAGVTL